MKRLIVVLFIMLLITACGSEQQKQKVIGQTLPPAPDKGYIVQVGDSFITKRAMENELAGMPENRRMRFDVPGGEDRLLDEMIKREMFRQEAVQAGMDQREDYRLRVEYLGRLGPGGNVS
ncbi:MAG: hypothetical protein EYX74_05275 [Desulfobulbaceae bacterium]|nr:MAG: hypothetical protein EYX74_05275 [Desulfobulbaceae bacterium]